MRYNKYSRFGFDSVSSIASTALATGALALGAYNIGKKDTSGCDAQFTHPLTLVTCPASDLSHMVFGGLQSLLEVSVQPPNNQVVEQI